MKHHPDDLLTLHREFPHVLFPVVQRADVDAMLQRAEELREARCAQLVAARYEQMQMGTWATEMRIDNRASCMGCGAREGETHPTGCTSVELREQYLADAKLLRARTKDRILASVVEPELTPAERTWRAHKGFSR